MTLILSLANSEVTVRIADRRLTPLGPAAGSATVISETATKVGSFLCGDARLAYSFAGLAYTGSARNRTFDARSWLRKALLRAAEESSYAEHIFESLEGIATAEFMENPEVRKCDRRLSVMFSGYWNTGRGCIPAGWILTNYQSNFDSGERTRDSPNAWERFRTWRWHQTEPFETDFVHVERLGQWKGVSESSMLHLRHLLAERRPPDALIGAGLAALRSASDSHRSAGTVGKSALIVVVPRRIEEEIRFADETNSASTTLDLPDIVVANDTIGRKWVTLGLDLVATPGAPLAAHVPRVHRNAPCPCGSGKRYRDCHRQYRRDIASPGVRSGAA